MQSLLGQNFSKTTDVAVFLKAWLSSECNWKFCRAMENNIADNSQHRRVPSPIIIICKQTSDKLHFKLSPLLGPLLKEATLWIKTVVESSRRFHAPGAALENPYWIKKKDRPLTRNQHMVVQFTRNKKHSVVRVHTHTCTWDRFFYLPCQRSRL